eukprot:12183343-Prorocentrum_lima.AAC.1
MGDIAPLARVMHGQIPGRMTELHFGPRPTSKTYGLLDQVSSSTILSERSRLIPAQSPLTVVS